MNFEGASVADETLAMDSALALPRLNGYARSEPRKTVALVHDWCPSFRGGERVLAELCRMFDGPSVYTLFDFLPPPIKDEFFANATFHTSVANRLPWVERYYRALFFFCL